MQSERERIRERKESDPWFINYAEEVITDKKNERGKKGFRKIAATKKGKKRGIGAKAGS